MKRNITVEKCDPWSDLDECRAVPHEYVVHESRAVRAHHHIGGQVHSDLLLEAQL